MTHSWQEKKKKKKETNNYKQNILQNRSTKLNTALTLLLS